MTSMSTFLRWPAVLAFPLFLITSAQTADAACIIKIDPGAVDARGVPRLYRCPPIPIAVGPAAPAEQGLELTSADAKEIPPRSFSRTAPKRSERDRLIARALGQGYNGFSKVYAGERYTGFKKVYRGQRYTGFRKVYSGPRYPSDLYGGGYWGF